MCLPSDSPRGSDALVLFSFAGGIFRNDESTGTAHQRQSRLRAQPPRPRQKRFDTFRHPHAHRINAVRNESPHRRPTHSTLFDTPRPTESTLCETKPPAPRPARFDTVQHPAPNRINALRNEIPPHPPETTHPGPTSPFDTFRHPRPIESTPCETKVRSHRAVTQRVQVPLQEFSVCLDS